MRGADELDTVELPAPTFEGSFKAFGSIMFAFAGASTFPTIQADMADRSKFNISAIIAMGILFLIYFPMAVGCYYSLGTEVKDNIVLAMLPGWMKMLVEIMLLLHLITAFPIITNPPLNSLRRCSMSQQTSIGSDAPSERSLSSVCSSSPSL